MDILEIPFHRLLNIEKHHGKEGFIFQLEERPELFNHLGTFHACAQLALAEASSGEFLRQQFPEMQGKVIPVIRKTVVKYSTPANGSLSSKASFSTGELEEFLNGYLSKGRIIIPVKVEVFNNENKKTLSAVFEWFITKFTA